MAANSTTGPGPTGAVEFDSALDRFSDVWNHGTPDRERFEME